MNYIKQNIKYLTKTYKIHEILEINQQSLNNKLSDKKRKFSVEDLIKISQETKIKIDDLIFKDLEKEVNE